MHGTLKYCGCCQPTTNMQTITKQYKSERRKASTIEQYGPSLPLGLVIMYVARGHVICMHLNELHSMKSVVRSLETIKGIQLQKNHVVEFL